MVGRGVFIQVVVARAGRRAPTGSATLSGDAKGSLNERRSVIFQAKY